MKDIESRVQRLETKYKPREYKSSTGVLWTRFEQKPDGEYGPASATYCNWITGQRISVQLTDEQIEEINQSKITGEEPNYEEWFRDLPGDEFGEMK